MRSETGFTMLSMLLALMTLTAAAFLISSVAAASFRVAAYQTNDRKDIWLFFHQLGHEVIGGTDFQMAEHHLTFNRDGKVIDFLFSGSTIRRRVDNKGYEIVLKNVENVSFEKREGTLSIQIGDAYGRSYRWIVRNMVK